MLGPAAWVLASALVVLLATRVDLPRVWVAFRSARWGWLALAMLCYVGIQPLGTLQWRALLPRGATVSFRRLLRVWTYTSIANNTGPSVFGHLTGLALLGAEAGVGRMSALSLLALDQTAVGLAKISVLALAALVAPLPPWIANGGYVLSATVFALAVLVTVAALYHDRIGTWARATHDGSTTRRIAPLIAAWTEGLDALRSPGRLMAAFAFALSIRAAELAAILFVQAAMGIEASLPGAILVLAATSLASFVAFVPANIGTYEAAVFAANRLLGVPPDLAFSLALVQHVCQLLPAVGVGYVVLTTERLMSRRRGAAQRP